MNCLDHEVLSAYADREATWRERVRVRLHLFRCGRCRRSLRLLAHMKEGLRRRPVPSMPEDLRRTLEGMIPPGGRNISARVVSGEGSLTERWMRVPRAAWVPALGLSLAGAALVLTSWRRASVSETEVSLDMILAAHRQYALTLPLAETERLVAALPLEFQSEDAEGNP